MQGPFGFPASPLLDRLSHSGGRTLRLNRPFFYPIVAYGVNPGGAAVNVISIIEGGRPFLWCATAWYAYPGAASMTLNTMPVPDVDVTLFMGAEPLSQDPVSITALAGAPNTGAKSLRDYGIEPFWLPGTTTIKAGFVNNEAAGSNTYTIRLILLGIQGTEA